MTPAEYMASIAAVTIRVTRDHINRARDADAHNKEITCPVTLAVIDAFPNTVSNPPRAGVWGYKPGRIVVITDHEPDGLSWEVPTSVQMFLRRWVAEWYTGVETNTTPKKYGQPTKKVTDADFQPFEFRLVETSRFNDSPWQYRLPVTA